MARLKASWGALLVASLSLGCAPAPARGPETPAPVGSEGLAPSAAPAASTAVTGSAQATTTTDGISAAVAAEDRSADDRALDPGRQPLELLKFAAVAAGQRVAELQAGGGYTAELLARVVGPSGHVFGQNNAFVLQRFAEKPWSERLTKPVMSNVTRVDRELDDPLPPEATNLDAVFLVLFYHDAVWMKTDRARMNTAIFRALRPGGVFVVVDHSARAGVGTADTQTLHRIEESIVRSEIESAGFRLAATAEFLRNPEDPRDWSTSPRTAGEKRGTSDRFVLKFQKP